MKVSLAEKIRAEILQLIAEEHAALVAERDRQAEEIAALQAKCDEKARWVINAEGYREEAAKIAAIRLALLEIERRCPVASMLHEVRAAIRAAAAKETI